MRALTSIVLLSIFICANSYAQSIELVTKASPYSYLKNRNVSGFASDVVESTLQRAGLSDYSVMLYPWARAYDIALQEPIVLIYPIIRSPVRETLFKWIVELGRVTPKFFKLRERSDIVVHGLQDAKNYCVGVVRDECRQQHLQE